MMGALGGKYILTVQGLQLDRRCKAVWIGGRRMRREGRSGTCLRYLDCAVGGGRRR